MPGLKFIAVATFATIASISGFAETKQWQSPDRFYSISVPTDWKQITTTIKSHTTYRSKSPDGQAEVAISAVYNLDLPEVLPNDVLEAAFSNEKGITDLKRIHGISWDGLKREYANASDTERWIGAAARNGSTVLLLTMTAPARSFDRFRDTFEKVAQSLTLGQ